MTRNLLLHLIIIGLLYLLHLTLPAYHHGQTARIMTLAVFAMGYNILFGYSGLLSLGHAMFFAAGMYGMGLSAQHLDVPTLPAFAIGIAAATLLAFVVGLLVLRTIGVGFMIVTLMFSQSAYLTILYFGDYTRGDEGFVLNTAARMFMGLDFSQADTRYLTALSLFSIALLLKLWLISSKKGRVMVAVRENEERARMLGYNAWTHKLIALTVSGAFAGASGAAYAVLFGYVGASFAAVPYSIFPLLWVLLGGAGTTLGPLIGTAFMVYLIDYASGLTDAYMLVVGVTLVLITLFVRGGILGFVRARIVPWLP